jgi:hypothetical protein
MRVGGQLHAPAVLPPGKRPGAHCIGGWVGLRPGWTAAENLAPSGFDPRTVQPVASRYTDRAILAYFMQIVCIRNIRIWCKNLSSTDQFSVTNERDLGILQHMAIKITVATLVTCFTPRL